MSQLKLKSSGRAQALSHWQSASRVFGSARSVKRCHVQEDATADGGMRQADKRDIGVIEDA